jgi:hypothetical protein
VRYLEPFAGIADIITLMEIVTTFSGDEYLAVGAVVERFFKFCTSEKDPQLLIFMGGIGTGKTTLRRKLPLNKYVQYDFVEISQAVIHVFGKDNPRLGEYIALASDIVFKDSINNKRNIVIEIIGEDANALITITDKMKDIGYEVQLSFVECDPAEAYQRHLKAVQEDPEYSSAYYSQEATMNPFLNHDLKALLMD